LICSFGGQEVERQDATRLRKTQAHGDKRVVVRSSDFAWKYSYSNGLMTRRVRSDRIWYCIQ